MVQKNFHRSRYQRYTGGPDPLAPPVDLREALSEIGDDVMAGVSHNGRCRSSCDAGRRTCGVWTSSASK